VRFEYVNEEKVAFRGEAIILPPKFSVSFSFRSSSEATITFHNAGCEQIAFHRIEGVEFTSLPKIERNAKPVAVHLQPDLEVPALCAVKLRWPEGIRADINIPFPYEGARFTRGPEVLPDGAVVHVDTLVGIKAEAFSRNRFSMTMKAFREQGEQEFELQPHELRESGDAQSGGRWELDLVDVREVIREALCCIGRSEKNIYGYIELRLEGLGRESARCRRSLKVKWFDHVIDLRKGEIERDALFVIPENGVRPESELNLRIVDVSDPRHFDETLPTSDPDEPASEEGGWKLSRIDLPPTRTLISAWKALSCRSRPTLYTPPGWETPECDGSTFHHAVSRRSPEEREKALLDLYDGMTKDPSHSGWSELEEAVKNFEYYPSLAFDFYHVLRRAPVTAAHALARGGTFSSIVARRLSDLIFFWPLISIEAWKSALRCSIPTTDRVSDEGKVLSSVVEVISSYRNLDCHSAAVAQKLLLWEASGERPQEFRAGLAEIFRAGLKEAGDELVRKHIDGETWPSHSEITRRSWHSYMARGHEKIQPLWIPQPPRSDYRFPVLDAPIIAAVITAFDLQVNDEVIRSLKLIKLFDPEWFRDAYHFALSYAVIQNEELHPRGP